MDNELNIKVRTEDQIESRRLSQQKTRIKRKARELIDLTSETVSTVNKFQDLNEYEQRLNARELRLNARELSLTLIQDQITERERILTERENVNLQVSAVSLMTNENESSTSFSDEDSFDMSPEKLARLLEIRNNLYWSEESDYENPSISKSVGGSMRTNVSITQKDLKSNAVCFIGDNISALQKEQRDKGRMKPSEYTLALPGGRFLDCERTNRLNMCLASKSNSPTNLFKKGTNVRAQANMRVVHIKGKLWLQFIRPVDKGDELFWKYGTSFKLNGDSVNGVSLEPDIEDFSARRDVKIKTPAIRTSSRNRDQPFDDAKWAELKKNNNK